jgi:hypothetical protein
VIKFADHLSSEPIQKINQMRRKQKAEVKVKKPAKVKEQLPRREWEKTQTLIQGETGLQGGIN